MPNKDNMTPSLKRIQKELAKIPQAAYDVWYQNTPVRSGNARRRTRLQGTIIRAAYDYAGRLDDGYSRQSPQGMSRPTERFIKKTVEKILRK